MSTGELLDLSTKRESAPAKAKRWRNKWLTSDYPINADTGERLGNGSGIYDSPRSWPSRSAAARDAQRIMAWNRDTGRSVPFWLGAFPCEGESPP